MSSQRGLIRHIIIALSFLFLVATKAQAQEYILEPGDVISITFWQAQELSVPQVPIDREGNIEIPIAGRITAAGLTISQLQARIVEKINIYNRNVTQAMVKVIEYGSKRIFITGAVSMPGPYTFENIPNIWEAIMRAGGPLETARLEEVTIVRGHDGHGQTIPVNLAAYFEQGDMSKLPELRPNDNLYVPGMAGGAGVGGEGIGGPPRLFSQRKEVYIYGAVARPGRYELQDNMDVLQAFIIAGATLTNNRQGTDRPTMEADLTKVRVISLTPQGPVSYSVNLEKYATEANPIPLRLRPGDTIYVPAKVNYVRYTLTALITTVVTSTISVLLSVLILDRIRGQQ